MGEWAMVVHGHGIHDNGREDDAESLLRDFVGQLALAGHEVQSAVFTVGGTRHLPPKKDTLRIESPPDDWQARAR